MKTFTPEEISTIVDAALYGLLWGAGEITDEDGNFTLESWDEIYDSSDATPELRETLTAEVSALDEPMEYDVTANKWQAAAHEFVEQFGLESFGHDMSMTRCRHGVGYWDRGAGDIGDTLTEWAHSLGELHIFHGSESVHPDKWAGMFHAE